MKRAVPIILIVVALAVALFLSRNAFAPQPATPDASSTEIQVPALTLSGAVEAPQSDLPVRVAALLDGASIADAPVRDGRYSLTLPATVPAPNTALDQISLLHGDGRLQGAGVKGEDITLLVYQDENRNGSYDMGEPKLEPGLLRSGSDPNLRAFLRYKIVLLDGAASFKGSLDNPTGAKNYYRYDLSAVRGYNIVQGDFASGGYEMSIKQGGNWDLLIPLPPGGKGDPPAFTP
jgi:hypothetical protein